MLPDNTQKLKKIAVQARKYILEMSHRAKSAHTGGALSCVEILVSLYFSEMKVFPKDPWHEKRDRLFFSKAHDAKALYAVLALRGYFDKKLLLGYELDGGKLPGHSTRHCVPGVEISAGSLGHGLPMAVGSAFGNTIKKNKARIFAILSDGECDEGSTWEAALFAGHHRLSQLIAIIDYNKLQGYGYTKDVLDLEPFIGKWKSFGWNAIEIDGHSFAQIHNAVKKASSQSKKPTVIIANTIKGMGGVEVHVGKVSSQYKPPTDEEFERLKTSWDK